MKQPNEVFDKEAFIARLLAIGTKPKPKPPVPTAQEKAQQAWKKQSLSAVLKAEKQTCEQALKAKEEALREAQEQRERDEYVRRQQQITESAVQLGYAQRRAEALAARRYDPTGLWGPANYRGPGEDW